MSAVRERGPRATATRIEPGYRRILVPVADRSAALAAVDLAAKLATPRQSFVSAVHVIEVPLDLPLDWELPDGERAAHALIEEARAVTESYGLSFGGRALKGRSAGPAIVDEAARRRVDLIVFGLVRRRHENMRAKAFGPTVDHVLRNAPCRVMVAAAPVEARR